MALKQERTITIKMNAVDTIYLDSHAESKGMNRSEFIKHCITAEFDRSKNEEAYKAKLNDFERLIQALSEVNSTAENTKIILGKGIIKIQEALTVLFPDNKAVEKIFYGEK